MIQVSEPLNGYVETAVDRWVSERAAKGKIIFVTGDPGDGKTHLIKKLEPDLRRAGADVCPDANEVDGAKLVKMIEQAYRKKTAFIVAINEGVLVALLSAAGDKPWTHDVQRQLLKPFHYSDNEADESGPIAVIDLNHRNNLTSDVVRGALKRLVELSAPCAGCPRDRCDGVQNAARLGEAIVIDRLVELLTLVAKSGYHATMRDLLGFLSYTLWGRRDCEGVKGTQAPAELYAENAFVGGVGPLFDAVRRFDPAAHTSPLLDDQLWRGAEDRASWHLQSEERYEPGDLDARRAAFERRKRRAYFEHRSGATILKDAGSEVDKALRALVDPERADPAFVVRLLNRFFDRDEERDEILHLWVTHRFDARAARYAAARWHVATNELEIRIPRLRPDLAKAFPEFHPDHVLLCRRGDAAEFGLRVDRTLLEALLDAEQGLPSTFRSGEPGARIAAFYDRLAKHCASRASGPVADVRFVDIDTGANMSLAVHVSDRKYVRK